MKAPHQISRGRLKRSQGIETGSLIYLQFGLEIQRAMKEPSHIPLGYAESSQGLETGTIVYLYIGPDYQAYCRHLTCDLTRYLKVCESVHLV